MEPDHWPESYKIIERGGMGEIEEKKSRFLSHVASVGTEEEALAFIEARRKEYWDARHNCYAYLLGEQGQTMRFSDDGEPGGTAGKPILEVLSASGVRNAVIVVTRYFGGTLLGTGGLVRAYTQAAQAGLAASRIGVMRYGYDMTVVTDYNGVGKLQYLLGQRELPVYDSDYGQQVTLHFYLPYEERESLTGAITEATAGRAQIEISKPFYYKSAQRESRI